MKLKTTILFFLHFVLLAATAQPGTLDSDFSGDGILTTSFFSASTDTAVAVLVQPDNKILSVGSSNDGSKNYATAMRLLPDGSFDVSFGIGGKRIISFSNGNLYARAAALQSDGKIIIAGSYRSSSSTEKFAIIRLKANGTQDSTFGLFGFLIMSFDTFQDYAHSVAIQSDGKIVVCGASHYKLPPSLFDYAQVALLRLNSNGSLDTTFSYDGKVTTYLGGIDPTSYGRSLAVQPDGKILVLAQGGVIESKIVRYNSDGTLDSGFGASGIATDFLPEQVYSQDMALQADGKIVCAANRIYQEGAVVYRCMPDGSKDTSFNHTGYLYVDELDTVMSIIVQPSGVIYMAGYYASSTQRIAVCSVTPNGKIDSSFSSDGIVLFSAGALSENSFVNDVSLQPDGRLVGCGVVSSTGASNAVMFRLFPSLVSSSSELAEHIQGLTVYPNPISDFINLKYTLTQTETISIRLFDIQGRLVATFLENEVQQQGEVEQKFLLPQGTSSGNYLVCITTERGTESIQIIKR